MRSMHFLGLLAAGLIAVAAVGCDDGGTDNDDGGGASGGAGGAGASGGAGGTGGTGGTGGGSTGDGNDTPETATEIELNSQTPAALDPIGEDVDWYKFTGTAGQKIVIQINAKPSDGSPTDPAYIDSVVTLFDEGQHQLAQNDDLILGEIQDSLLFTVLPADGTYYVQVSECNQVFGMCGNIDEITDTNYELLVGDINQSILVNEMTPGPTTYEYSGGPGMYDGKLLSGTFSAAPEVDTYSFMLPADVQVEPETRSLSRFLFFPAGTEGSGSSAAVERASIIDTATGAKVAELSAAQLEKGGQLWLPLTPGGMYSVELEHTAGAVDASSFYFNWTFPEESSYVLEREVSDPLQTNNTPLQSEELVPVQATDAVVYYVEGDLENAGQALGLDHYSFDVTGYALAQAYCSSWIYGSGVRDLTATIVDATNTELGAATETEAEPAFANDVAVPAGQTALALRISAGAQDANVTGTYYRCIVAAYNQ